MSTSRMRVNPPGGPVPGAVRIFSIRAKNPCPVFAYLVVRRFRLGDEDERVKNIGPDACGCRLFHLLDTGARATGSQSRSL